MRDLEHLALVRRQSMIVAAVFLGSATALYEGASPAAALVLAAAMTQVLIACRALVVRESRRVHVLELISEGRGALPIPAVERACAGLCQPRHRRRLAQSVDALLDSQIGRFDVVTMPWRLMRADVIAPVRSELAEIAALLRDDPAGVAGIAMIDRLVGDGTSSLHGQDVQALREDLRRARFYLGAR